MRALLVLASIAFTATLLPAQQTVIVRPHVRRNGQFVMPHARTSPDASRVNNFGFPGMVNPYSGKIATGNPWTYISPMPAPRPRAYRAPITAPRIYAQDGKYLGTLGDNKFDADSVSNPFGRYGSKYSPDSINNPYGVYGSRFSTLSPNNPYTTTPPVVIGE